MATQLKQRTDAWREAKRSLVTATDIPVILGLSPYKSEATLARQKLGLVPETEETLIMQIGAALEPVIAAEYTRQTGYRLHRFRGIVYHRTIEWAACSPDWRRFGAGNRVLVEGKYSTARRWRDHEVPEDVEAQVRWQLGVTDYPVADVAHLDGRVLNIATIEHDDATFDGLVAIATDFRRRLAEGGPFAEDAASIKAAYPADDGTELVADEALTEAVVEWRRLVALRESTEAAEERIKVAIKTRMGLAARMDGDGWTVRYKRNKPSSETNWELIADGLLRQLPADEREALVSIQTRVTEGARPLKFYAKKEEGEG